MPNSGFMLHVFVFQSILLALGLLLARWTGQDPLASCRWSLEAVALGTLGGAAMGFAALKLTSLPVFSDLERMVDRGIAPWFDGLSMQDLVAISLMAGASEEVLFRGALQPWMALWLPGGEWTAITAAAALFGLCHALSPAYFLFAFGLGAVFGWASWAMQDLAFAIILHAAYDAVVLLDMSLRRQQAEK